MTTEPLELFIVCPPGMEPHAAAEAQEAGFAVAGTVPGGVTLMGGWAEARRANMTLRGAVRVLARIARFRAMHPAQLDKRARKLPWTDWLRADVPVRVEASCHKSRIYHAGAAATRVAGAIHDATGARIMSAASQDAVSVKVRIDDDLCTISLDTTGPALHRRGVRQRMHAAPMRETLAALFLRAAGYDPEAARAGTPLFDPMCGAGTFPIEAAEMAQGLLPGRARGFALDRMACAAALDDPIPGPARGADSVPPAAPFCIGADRDAGAVAMAVENAARAGVATLCRFAQASISEARPPSDRPGLVIVNPPYGGRIGKKKALYGLYATFGRVMAEHFGGWRVALMTSEDALARATGLPFAPPGPPVPNGGIRVRLWLASLDA